LSTTSSCAASYILLKNWKQQHNQEGFFLTCFELQFFIVQQNYSSEIIQRLVEKRTLLFEVAKH
jgi:hypothetical protein